MITLDTSHRVDQFCAAKPNSLRTVDAARYYGDLRLLVATNGSAIITTPVAGEHPDAFFPRDVLAKIKKPTEVDSNKVGTIGHAVKLDGQPEFPAWQPLFDGKPPELLFVISPASLRLLADHATATGAAAVYLGVSDFDHIVGGSQVSTSPIRFCYYPASHREQSEGSDVVSGIVMPCEVQQTDVVGELIAEAFDVNRNRPPTAPTHEAPRKASKKAPAASTAKKPASEPAKAAETPPAKRGSRPKTIAECLADARTAIVLKEYTEARKALGAAEALAGKTPTKDFLATVAKLRKRCK